MTKQKQRPWPEGVGELWPLAKIKPYAKNARTHPDSQIEILVGLLLKWGPDQPIVVDEDGVILKGHGRRIGAERAAKEDPRFEKYPVVQRFGLSAEEKKALRISDNQVALLAGWDEQLLKAEMVDLNLAGYDMPELGFAPHELTGFLAPMNTGNTEADSIPSTPKSTITKHGDLWTLGDHRLLCGDSTSPGDVGRLMDGKRVVLLHADPPYGMGKEAEGVLNDNLYAEKLDKFQMEWWRAYRPHIADNAGVYVWGNAPDLWRLWYAGGLGKSEPLTFRNEIVWDKGSQAGMASPYMGQFVEATERCLFFQLGRHVLMVNQTKDDYWKGWEPIRSQLNEQREKMGWKASDIKRICENHMHGHWFGTSQWMFISRENYEKLTAAAGGKAFTRKYEDLRGEYQKLLEQFNGAVRGPRRKEFNEIRPYFDNSHSIMRDVWEFPRVTGDDRHGHATPKPVAMMERIMRSSAREADVVAEPFGGSGSTMIGCEIAGRRAYVMELSAKYCDVIVERWQQFSGKKANLERSGGGKNAPSHSRKPVRRKSK